MNLRRYEESDWVAVADLFNRVFADRFRLLADAVRAGRVRNTLSERKSNAAESAAWIVQQG